jgi:hypothetical protein
MALPTLAALRASSRVWNVTRTYPSDEVRPDARLAAAPDIAGRGQARERPGLATVVTSADPDRAPRDTVGRRAVRGDGEVEATRRRIDVEAVQPHRIRTDVAGGARRAGARRRELGLADGGRDPRRSDGEGLRRGVEVDTGDRDAEPSHVARPTLRKDLRSVPSAEVDLVPGGVHAPVRGGAEAVPDPPPVTIATRTRRRAISVEVRVRQRNIVAELAEIQTPVVRGLVIAAPSFLRRW